MHGNKEVGHLLKGAVKYALETIGLNKAAEQTRLDAGTLSRASNPEYGNNLPIDDAVRLDRIAKEPIITREMAHLLGYELVPLLKAQRCVTITSQAGKIAGESGDLVRETITDLSDGQLSQNEIKRIDRERLELSSAVAALGEMIHK